jgi:hypothetical protein
MGISVLNISRQFIKQNISKLNSKLKILFTCNQNSGEDSPKQQDNHHDKGYSSNARSEPTSQSSIEKR